MSLHLSYMKSNLRILKTKFVKGKTSHKLDKTIDDVAITIESHDDIEVSVFIEPNVDVDGVLFYFIPLKTNDTITFTNKNLTTKRVVCDKDMDIWVKFL